MQAAFATRAGVFSALLAARGITAPRDAFEGKFGLYQLYQEGDPAKVLDELGVRFDHASTALKKYPCCACSHAALEAALGLVHEHDLAPDDVLAVEVSHSPLMHRLVGAPFEPKDNAQVTAQFSVRYAIASALLRRRLGIAEIQDDAIHDPRIKSLTDRIDVVVDETSKGSRTPATVTMKTRTHGTLKRTGTKFPWGPEDPPTTQSLRTKFDECMASGAKPLSDNSRELLVQRVEQIETIGDMSQFFAGIA
jgi:2-methylcitrate dehydratase PrpD